MSLIHCMGINRNIVECKGRIRLPYILPGQVLIETLWNVKSVCIVERMPLVTVLIETLWNVKMV